MATTYLQLVNDVLSRLRESSVTSVDQTNYSSLIGKLVNDAKREVEASWNWDALRTSYSISTSSGTYNYPLVGAGNRFRVLDSFNDTSNWFLEQRPASYFTENINLSTDPLTGSPLYYAFNGIDANGDIKVDLFPKPDAAYTLTFNVFRPEEELEDDTDTTALPKYPIVLLAWAKAIEERGEDGGINVSSQYAVASKSLSDYIAIEANRRPEEFSWDWK